MTPKALGPDRQVKYFAVCFQENVGVQKTGAAQAIADKCVLAIADNQVVQACRVASLASGELGQSPAYSISRCVGEV